MAMHGTGIKIPLGSAGIENPYSLEARAEEAMARGLELMFEWAQAAQQFVSPVTSPVFEAIGKKVALFRGYEEAVLHTVKKRLGRVANFFSSDAASVKTWPERPIEINAASKRCLAERHEKS